MAKQTKAEVGDIRPVYQQVGWEVCAKAAEKPEEEAWISTEKEAEALILSHTLKEEKKPEDE